MEQYHNFIGNNKYSVNQQLTQIGINYFLFSAFWLDPSEYSEPASWARKNSREI
jgi:arabinogalactan endo-1,4-beta-galactosidase